MRMRSDLGPTAALRGKNRRNTMNPVIRWWGRRLPTLMSLMPALLFAMPAFALSFTDPAGVADPAEPGSVLVYPKFSTGSVTVDAGTGGAFTAPRTEIELGA